MLVLAASALLVTLGMGVALGAPAIALVLEAEDRAKNEEQELVATGA
jgi:hypothetical protein